MTSPRTLIIAIAILLVFPRAMANTLRQGFSLPDSLEEFKMIYRTMDNLILLPFRVNDTLDVNLVLDTSCRTLILFGNHFGKFLPSVPGKTVEFSGMGTGKPARGCVSLGNNLRMGPVTGENIPIVIVTQKTPFKSHMRIDGLIGYDIFTRFEVEVHPHRQEIIFRPAFNRNLPEGYDHIPLMMTDQKPMTASTISFPEETLMPALLIDTGSTLCLLLKTSDKSRLNPSTNNLVLGKGLNGTIRGHLTTAQKVLLHAYEIEGVPAGVTYTGKHDYASIGMGTLKNYSIVINCVQAYMGLRPHVPAMEDIIL